MEDLSRSVAADIEAAATADDADPALGEAAQANRREAAAAGAKTFKPRQFRVESFDG